MNFEDIKMDLTLDDILNLLERNKPNRNNKLFNAWRMICDDIQTELYGNEEEHPNECERLTNEALEVLQALREKKRL